MRRALLIGFVFSTFGALALLACSGFSSSDANESNDASAADGSIPADDSQVVSEDAQPVGEGGVTDSSVADSGHKLRVFVTSSVHKGDFQNGSAICANLATDAGLGGDWFAWLSKASTSARSSLSSRGPWSRATDGKLVAEASDAGAVEVLTAISWTEHGEPAQGTPFVWTGTYSNGGTGSSSDLHCASWSQAGDSGKSGIVGDMSTTSSWTSNGILKDCGNAYHLYCFEVD